MLKVGEDLGFDQTNRKNLVANLKDAGCEPEIVLLFLQLCEDEKTSDQLRLLAEHRKKLLDEIHRDQAKLDCLDYLIYQMRKNRQCIKDETN